MSGFNCFVIVFNSTYQALSAEQALRASGIRHAVVNTPREFTVDCGISIRIEPRARDAAVSVLDEKGVIYAGVEPYFSRWI